MEESFIKIAVFFTLPVLENINYIEKALLQNRNNNNNNDRSVVIKTRNGHQFIYDMRHFHITDEDTFYTQLNMEEGTQYTDMVKDFVRTYQNNIIYERGQGAAAFAAAGGREALENLIPPIVMPVVRPIIGGGAKAKRSVRVKRSKSPRKW